MSVYFHHYFHSKSNYGLIGLADFYFHYAETSMEPWIEIVNLYSGQYSNVKMLSGFLRFHYAADLSN